MLHPLQRPDPRCDIVHTVPDQRQEGYAEPIACSIDRKLTATPDMTTLKYVEPAAMGSTEEPKPVTTTNMDYDKGQLRQALRSQLMGVGMMGVMHLYFQYTNPLLIQSIIPLKGAFESNLAKIHVFGKPATGDLARPFKAGGGFMSAGAPKTDKASIDAAEKNWRGGVKEE